METLPSLAHCAVPYLIGDLILLPLSFSLLQALTHLVSALRRTLFAKYKSHDKNTAAVVQMADHSPVPDGRIPYEESIVKDGATYRPFSGPLNRVQKDIQYYKHKKWGFLIYRCDYASDEAWSKFLSNLNWEIEEGLRILKAEDLRDTLEMTPKEDKEALDGATVDQVRNIFTEWVRSDEARAEINNEPCGAFTYPRYTYCVHVDADVLDSVVNRAPQPPSWDPRNIAYVNLVQLRHEAFAERLGLTVQETTNNHEEDKEQDDGDIDESEYGEEHFVKVPLSYVGPEHYNELYSQYTFEQFVRYQRSDDVSFGGGGINPEDMYGPLL